MNRLLLLLLLAAILSSCQSSKVDIDSEYNGIFLARDISYEPSNYTIINTTCVAISKNVYFYIENGLAVEPDILWELITSFEARLDKFRKVYGSWKDTDKNGKLIFIIADLNPKVMGYFSPFDRLSQSELDKLYRGYKSNEADILYITYDYLKKEKWQEKSEKVMATLFHELSHAVIGDSRNGKPPLPLWLDEGMARYAEYSVGFKNIFANDDSRLELISSEPGYPYAYLFIKYLVSTYGEGIIKKVIASKNEGFQILTSATKSSFSELYSMFIFSLMQEGALLVK